MGSLAAFNRNRAQRIALADAAKRPPQEVAESQEAVNAIPVLVEDQDELASPPYADADQLINVQGDSDLDREMEGMRQAELNKTRKFSREALDELQNSHLHEPKVKAIPDPVEMGQDRTVEGQKAARRKAEAPYKDDRVKPERDGRIRATEPEEDRPDGDTTVSDVVTNVDTYPMDEDDDPKHVERMVAEHPVENPEPAPAARPKRRGKASEAKAEQAKADEAKAAEDAKAAEARAEEEKAAADAEEDRAAEEAEQPAEQPPEDPAEKPAE